MAIAINPTTLDIPITLADFHVPVQINLANPGNGLQGGGRAGWLERRVVIVPFVGDENDATGSATFTLLSQDYEIHSINAMYDAQVPSGSVLTISSPDAIVNLGKILVSTGNTDKRFHPREPAEKAADGTAITDGHEPIIVQKGGIITCDLTMAGGVVGSPAAIDLDIGVALVFIIKSVK